MTFCYHQALRGHFIIFLEDAFSASECLSCRTAIDLKSLKKLKFTWTLYN